ncbi:unnamed protein product [Cuscuta epithymum]|uniref:HORMA domain-containing protein n=1 Tax=Cuscuta epithymum TaxID=186058 RepID=A0AAV0G7F1_9ASTE|nr:unnamed protein product [Cuscuta epithymum]CAH9143502.1 unnamed protein product [Cuscuta epithymum]
MDHIATQATQTARVLVEFLEVAINSVIFLKGVYPTVSGAFERRRYLNVVVHKSRHPELRDYIHSSVNGLLPFIQKGEVERVAVNFFDNQNVPIERFVFKIDVKQSYGSSVEEEGAAAAADLELSFRSFLIKLASSYSLTHTLPPDCRWEITGYFRALPDSRSSASRIWVSTGTKQWQQPPVIMPIKSMKSEALVLQLYLEHPPTPLHQNLSLS